MVAGFLLRPTVARITLNLKQLGVQVEEISLKGINPGTMADMGTEL